MGQRLQRNLALITAATLSVCVGCTTSQGSGSTTSQGSGNSTPPPGSHPGTGVPTTKPNVLFVLTDDMRIDDLRFMPEVNRLIGAQGMTFDNYFDNVTLCCPARTSILRGQYSHNTGILTNGGDNGGFETAHASGIESSTIATAMRSAGYATGLFGKYLNGYPRTADESYVPPGWDRWSSASRGDAYSEYGYTLNEDGKQVSYGLDPPDYGTDVYVRQTKSFIHDAATSNKPFFAYLAVYAPHQPATPAPGDESTFPDLEAPRDAAFDEVDVADKPAFVKELPAIDSKTQRKIDELARRRAQSLQAVDRGVAQLIDDLSRSGQLDNTYVMFTSDNGFHLGQHRLRAGKQTAYETDIHLPLLVRGPGVDSGKHAGDIAGNVDLAPTIADIAGASLTDNPDGRSVLPFMSSKPPAADSWRNSFLLEHWTQSSAVEPASTNQLEPDDLDQGGAAGQGSTPTSADQPASTRVSNQRLGAAVTTIPEFQGLRTAGLTYVEYITGERELYDLAKDPDELDNLAGSASPKLLGSLHDRLEQLRHCAGQTCRSIESAPLDLSS